MKSVAIQNWTGSQELEVDSYNDTVYIRQIAGSMSFLFFMTPEQAHELADELVRVANKIEPDMPVESC